MESEMDPVVAWALALFIGIALFGVVIPFSPMIIAISRKHSRSGTIIAFNVFTYVTSSLFVLISIIFPGAFVVAVLLFPIWIWMFVWAVMGKKKLEAEMA
jgi:uncharacterized membrane protein